MNGILKIGNKDVKMTANALTPILFKRMFHADMVKMVQEYTAKKDDDTLAEIIDHAGELGYIMAVQADGSKKNTDCNEEDYFEWLTQFETLDLTTASGDIINLYVGNTVADSEPKKKEDQQKEK